MGCREVTGAAILSDQGKVLQFQSGTFSAVVSNNSADTNCRNDGTFPLAISFA